MHKKKQSRKIVLHMQDILQKYLKSNIKKTFLFMRNIFWETWDKKKPAATPFAPPVLKSQI